MNNAELNKKQREDVLNTWKDINAYLEDKNFQTLKDFVDNLPEGCELEEFNPLRNYVLCNNMPWKFCFYLSPFANRVIIQTDVLYFNEKTRQWEETGHNGY